MGGASLFDPREFDEAGVRLRFLSHDLPAYPQRRLPFVNGLSVLDAMMWLPPNELRGLIASYRLLDADQLPGIAVESEIPGLGEAS